MVIDLVSEYNGSGVLMHLPAYPGAYTRGESEDTAFGKAKQELHEYIKWAGFEMPPSNAVLKITKRVKAIDSLQINDADTEILLDFDSHRLSKERFDKWSGLALFSAECVMQLYNSIRDKNWVQREKLRPSFLSKPPSTAEEMFLHIDVVSRFYTSRIGIDESFKSGALIENRQKCIGLLRDNYMTKPFKLFLTGGELWTETKILRRFIWHDRIHAKALYRHGLKMGMKSAELANPFFIEISPQL
jgi:hypothetical protein